VGDVSQEAGRADPGHSGPSQRSLVGLVGVVMAGSLTRPGQRTKFGWGCALPGME